MTVAVPTFGSRVAPTFLHSEAIRLVHLAAGETVSSEERTIAGLTEDERIKLLEEYGVSTLVCGGIGRELADELRSRGIEVIHNVAGEANEVIGFLARGDLRPGHGITYHPERRDGDVHSAATVLNPPSDGEDKERDRIDCVDCTDKVCLKAMSCPRHTGSPATSTDSIRLQQTMEVTLDIAAEPERILCRVAELVYFCLGMKYKHLGLAFCTDLFAEAETITRVLRRFFRVTPVCCKVGNGSGDQGEPPDDGEAVWCNPFEMARVLNAARTDLNVILGLCMGSDVAFTQLSRAPVTTLFVKDRLLANNPVAAVHSRYVLDHVLSRT